VAAALTAIATMLLLILLLVEERVPWNPRDDATIRFRIRTAAMQTITVLQLV
jgi:hypothetical protein